MCINILFFNLKSHSQSHIPLSLICFEQVMDSQVTLCKYPFVFDAQAKTTLLQTDAVIQMQVRELRRI